MNEQWRRVSKRGDRKKKREMTKEKEEQVGGEGREGKQKEGGVGGIRRRGEQNGEARGKERKGEAIVIEETEGQWGLVENKKGGELVSWMGRG